MVGRDLPNAGPNGEDHQGRREVAAGGRSGNGRKSSGRSSRLVLKKLIVMIRIHIQIWALVWFREKGLQAIL